MAEFDSNEFVAYPTLRQLDKCRKNCLCVIAGYYGLPVSISWFVHSDRDDPANLLVLLLVLKVLLLLTLLLVLRVVRWKESCTTVKIHHPSSRFDAWLKVMHQLELQKCEVDSGASAMVYTSCWCTFVIGFHRYI